MRAILICENPRLAHVVLGSLHANRFETRLVCNSQTIGSARSSRLHSGVLFCGDLLSSAGDVIRAINAEHDRISIDLVVAGDVCGSVLLGSISQHVIPPIFDIPDIDTVELLDDKSRFYELVLSLDIRTPRTVKFESRDDLDLSLVAGSVGFPAVVKPTKRWAGIGVYRVTSKDELRAQIWKDTSLADGFIVQQFIAGNDIGFGAFARGGKTIAHCTFTCGDRDATEFIIFPELSAYSNSVIEHTGYSGVINFDARIDLAGRVWMTECNPRFFMRTRAARLCGLDFLAVGLASPTQPVSKTPEGCFYSQGDLLSLVGLGHILSGKWSLQLARRTLHEVLHDPLPSIMRRLGLEQM